MKLEGYARVISIALIAASVLFVTASYWRYGQQAQALLQLNHIIPLLFAGLALGRRAVWITTVALLGALLAGMFADVRAGAETDLQDGLASLMQPGLACLILALILDRLIAKSDHADQRSRELELAFDQLEIEIKAKEQKQAQLIHSQKMDALGQLASGIAHDFNNLLSVILGYATDPMNLARSRQALDSLEAVEQAARRGSEVTRRLLSLSRDAGQATTFDAGVALTELMPLVRSLFAQKTAVALELPAAAFPVFMDKQEFELAILNIASNARDAMPQGGEFKMAVSGDGNRVRVALADNGMGMAPEVSARMFEPFYTTKPEGAGTGIGMAIVLQSIAEAGGNIDVASAPALGTTIRIDLPHAGRNVVHRRSEGSL
ncbi:MAG TPA: ATP-binding protein [Pseudoxanthomonas sp.]